MRLREGLCSEPVRPAILVAVIFSCAAPGLAQGNGDIFNFFPLWGHLGGPNISICRRTAYLADYVCHQEANLDSLSAAAIANNISDLEEQDQALKEGRIVQARAGRECFEQFQARVELCGRLDENRYDPEFDEENFGPVTDPNSYFPLLPGTVFVYEGETEEGSERNVVTVTDETREIEGVECTVVRDQVFVDDTLTEDTQDYFAQDLDGNVWYFGEDTLEIDEDGFLNIDGSWRAGEEGAKAGLIMRAAPFVGDIYRQEFALGEAEDAAQTLSLTEEVSVAQGDYTNCLMSSEFTPLEPDALEYKYYAPGVGFVLAVDAESGRRLELIEVTQPLSGPAAPRK